MNEETEVKFKVPNTNFGTFRAEMENKVLTLPPGAPFIHLVRTYVERHIDEDLSDLDVHVMRDGIFVRDADEPLLVRIKFKTPNDAMMFKLTYGGAE